jgi:hypothetical protein
VAIGDAVFQVFQKYVFKCFIWYGVYCDGYIRMLNVYVSSVSIISNVCFYLDVAEVYLDVA